MDGWITRVTVILRSGRLSVVVSPSNGGFVTRDLQSIGCVQLALSKGNEGE